jgi:transcriptional regulator with GAF, ATPase, and Fis domain
LLFEDDASESIAQSEHIIELSKHLRYPNAEADAYRVKAWALRKAGERDASERAFADACACATPPDLVLVRFRILCDHARVICEEAREDDLPLLARLLDRAEESSRALEHPSFSWEVRVLRALSAVARREPAALEQLDHLLADLKDAHQAEEISSHLHKEWWAWIGHARPRAEEHLRVVVEHEEKALAEVVRSLDSEQPEQQLERFCQLVKERFRAERMALVVVSDDPQKPRVMVSEGLKSTEAQELARPLLNATGEHRAIPLILGETLTPSVVEDESRSLDLVVSAAYNDGLRGRSAMVQPILGTSLPVAVLYVDRPAPNANGSFGTADCVAMAAMAQGLTAILRLTSMGRGGRRLRERLVGLAGLGRIVTRSPVMAAELARIKAMEESTVSVLITGETGTGKELLAQTVHENSPRRNGPLVAINCAAIPVSMAEAEFFGYVKGAFTDAKTDRPGLLQQASGGSLFLDEIGEMPLELQAKLLRALQEQEVRQVGGRTPHRIDVRLIAATNLDLTDEVASGRFRQDLRYRVSAFRLNLPPLRDRREDIPILVDHFMEVFRTARSIMQPLRLSREALSCCCRYAWPGNVRELENVIMVAAEFRDPKAGIIESAALPEEIRASTTDLDSGVGHSSVLEEMFQWICESGNRHVLDEIQRYAIKRAFEVDGSSFRAVARTLGMRDTSLKRLRERLKIERTPH